MSVSMFPADTPAPESPTRSWWRRPAGIEHATLLAIVSALVVGGVIAIARPLYVDWFMYLILLALIGAPPALVGLAARCSIAALAVIFCVSTIAAAGVGALGASMDRVDPTGDPGSVVALFFFGGLAVIASVITSVITGVLIGIMGVYRRFGRAGNLRP